MVIDGEHWKNRCMLIKLYELTDFFCYSFNMKVDFITLTGMLTFVGLEEGFSTFQGNG